MKVGTKSVLFGAHAFWLHPWFIAAGWWKLYGFPWQPWLWIAFFVHDIGYFGKPNMDGPEGEEHPRVGADIMYSLQIFWVFLKKFMFRRIRFITIEDVKWWQLRRQWLQACLSFHHSEKVVWGNEVLYHSRFFAKKYGTEPSRLCMADKMAIVLTPTWLYLPMVKLTGEIDDYMNKNPREISGEGRTASQWHKEMKEFVRNWIKENDV